MQDSARTVALPVLLLFAGSCLLFWGATRADFISLDDPAYVYEDAHVHAGLSAAGVRTAFTSPGVELWVPLVKLSFMLEVSLFGLEPAVFHTTNVLLHALNAALLFLLLRWLTGQPLASFLAAALFAWHPMRVESVAWVTERKDLLAGTFGLAALLLYTASIRAASITRRRRLFWAAFVASCAGLMAKPILVMLPALLLVVDFWSGREIRRKKWPLLREKWPFIMAAVAVAALTLTLSPPPGEAVLPGWLRRLANAPAALAWMVWKMFHPVGLALLRPYAPPFVLPLWQTLASAALLVAGCWIALRLALRGSGRAITISAGWWWFLLAALPLAGLVVPGNGGVLVFDHYTYFPHMGLACVVVWGGSAASEKFPSLPSWSPAAITASALAACVALTFHQIPHWKNSHSLFAHNVDLYPHSHVAREHLGHAHMARGDLPAAEASFRAGLELSPGSRQLRESLALAIGRQGRFAEADEQFAALAAEFPQTASIPANRGAVALLQKDVPRALEHLQAAEALSTSDPNVFFNLGQIHQIRGDLVQAEHYFHQVLKLRPTHASAAKKLAELVRKP